MNELIIKTSNFVKEKLEKDSSGHDFWHIYRVWKNAKNIGSGEGVNMEVVELAALLHDLGDYKLNNGIELGSKPAREWLEKNGCERGVTNAVCHIIDNMSFNKMKDGEELSLEGKVVQDADRLDALGAIGIARCFAFAGNKGNLIYDPDVEPNLNKTPEEYRKANASAINHFYEKLLLLKDKMNTKTGKKLQKVDITILKNLQFNF